MPMRRLSNICVCVCWQVQGLPLLSPSVWGRINLPVSHLTPPACYATYHEQYLCVCVCLCVCPVILSTSVSPSSLPPVVLFVCLSSLLAPAVSFVPVLSASDRLHRDAGAEKQRPLHILILDHLPLLLWPPHLTCSLLNRLFVSSSSLSQRLVCSAAAEF